MNWMLGSCEHPSVNKLWTLLLIRRFLTTWQSPILDFFAQSKDNRNLAMYHGISIGTLESMQALQQFNQCSADEMILMNLCRSPKTKRAFATRHVPIDAQVHVKPMTTGPEAGDLVCVEVLTIGRHTSIEDSTGIMRPIFVGDVITGVFGNRYATDQFEGYIPDSAIDEADLLSMGGLVGIVASKHDTMIDPTRVKVLGLVCDATGYPLNTRKYKVSPVSANRTGELIVVVGTSMNSGKTTTVGTITRALSQAGYAVATAKITGTSAGKDLRYFTGCGADVVYDFTDVGHPSTYMLTETELLDTAQSLVSVCKSHCPDFVVIEIADGIFQRETKMILEDQGFQNSIDHIFFAAGDSMGAECGVRTLKQMENLPKAVSGMVSRSLLSRKEAEEATGVPCLCIEDFFNGRILEILGCDEGASHSAYAS